MALFSGWLGNSSSSSGWLQAQQQAQQAQQAQLARQFGNYGSSSQYSGYSPVPPKPEGPVDVNTLPALRDELVAKLTIGGAQPGFRTGDADMYSPDLKNQRVLELIYAVLLSEGLLRAKP